MTCNVLFFSFFLVFSGKMKEIFDAPNSWDFRYEEMGDMMSEVDDLKATVSADSFVTLLEALTGEILVLLLGVVGCCFSP